jgi:hypothetical protein
MHETTEYMRWRCASLSEPIRYRSANLPLQPLKSDRYKLAMSRLRYRWLGSQQVSVWVHGPSSKNTASVSRSCTLKVDNLGKGQPATGEMSLLGSHVLQASWSDVVGTSGLWDPPVWKPKPPYCVHPCRLIIRKPQSKSVASCRSAPQETDKHCYA